MIYIIYIYTFNTSSNPSDDACATSSSSYEHGLPPVNNFHLALVLAHHVFTKSFPPLILVAHAKTCVKPLIYPYILSASIS